MARTVVLPTTAVTKITIGVSSSGPDLSCVANSYNITQDRQQFNNTTFCNENDGLSFLYGSTVYTVTLAGLQYEGAPEAGMGIGIERFDGLSCTIQANSSSTITGTMQPARGSTGRDAGSVGQDSLTFNLSGVTVSWDRT